MPNTETKMRYEGDFESVPRLCLLSSKYKNFRLASMLYITLSLLHDRVGREESLDLCSQISSCLWSYWKCAGIKLE